LRTPLLTPISPSYMVVPESNIANTHNSKKLMSPNIENTKARPDDTALSIQRGCPPSCASTESSCSSSLSLMDDSPPSDCNYAERVAVQNNMDIVNNNAPPPLVPRGMTSLCCLHVTNFIQSYLHQFFDYSHGLKASLKPLRRPFDRYQSHLEAINNG